MRDYEAIKEQMDKFLKELTGLGDDITDTKDLASDLRVDSESMIDSITECMTDALRNVDFSVIENDDEVNTALKDLRKKFNSIESQFVGLKALIDQEMQDPAEEAVPAEVIELRQKVTELENDKLQLILQRDAARMLLRSIITSHNEVNSSLVRVDEYLKAVDRG